MPQREVAARSQRSKRTYIHTRLLCVCHALDRSFEFGNAEEGGCECANGYRSMNLLGVFSAPPKKFNTAKPVSRASGLDEGTYVEDFRGKSER